MDKGPAHLSGSGGAIDEILAEQGSTLRELATKLGWEEATLTDIRDNRRPISEGEILEFAHRLQLPPMQTCYRFIKAAYPRMDQRSPGRLARALGEELDKPPEHQDKFRVIHLLRALEAHVAEKLEDLETRGQQEHDGNS